MDVTCCLRRFGTIPGILEITHKERMAEAWDVEVDVLPGMEAILARELRRCFRGRVGQLADTGRASLRFAFQGSLGELLGLRTAHAAYLALAFSGRRPTALLGHQNLRALLERIQVIR